MKKKLLSFLLIFAMMLSMIPAGLADDGIILLDGEEDAELISLDGEADDALPLLDEEDDYDVFEIDGESFPDETFRAYVLENVDTDRNGWLSVNEMLAVTELDLACSGVASLKGVEYFDNLRLLDCSGDFGVPGQLTEVDLSFNRRLRSVNLAFNPIETIDVTMLTKLETLSLGFTELSEIDLSRNEKLLRLWADNSHFSELNLHNNTKLEKLDVCGNPDLLVVDIRLCPSLVRDYLAGGRRLEKFKEMPEMYESILVYGGEGDEDYNLSVNTTMTVLAEIEEPELPAPDLFNVDGTVFRLSRGFDICAEGDYQMVIVARAGDTYRALNVSGNSVAASALTVTEDGLSGSAAVLDADFGLQGGGMLYAKLTDEDAGRAVLAVGTPNDGYTAEWRDFDDAAAMIHRLACYLYNYDKGVHFGEWIWFLTFSGGSFVLSDRTSTDAAQYGAYPDNCELLLYLKPCEHPNKIACPAREPDCTHYGHTLYYYCPDCGKYLDAAEDVYCVSMDWDGSTFYGTYDLRSFVTSPALGHDYDHGTGVCSRCGEAAPVYEPVTDISMVCPGNDYLIVDAVTGLALDLPRPVSDGEGGWIVPDLDAATEPTVQLPDGLLTVYGTGGAPFRLLENPDEEYAAAGGDDGYPALIEGGFSFVEDYSWDFERPLSFTDMLTDDYELNYELWYDEDEEGNPVEVREYQFPTALYFNIRGEDDAVIHYFDSSHPFVYDEELCFRQYDGEAWSWIEDPETGGTTEVPLPTGLSLYRRVVEHTGPYRVGGHILEVSNYSHYYGTGQYYEGAFVAWKEKILLDGRPMSEYSEDELALLGEIGVQWIDDWTGEPAIIDYDGRNSNYFTGPARVGSYRAVLTQTLDGVTRAISPSVWFEITPTQFVRVTNYDDITTGARWYLYSIMGEIDGQLYVMAMPEPEGTLRAEAIPAEPDENGVVSLGELRENVFCMRRDPNYHRWGDASHPERNLLQLVTGTSWNVYFGGANGSVWRGGGWTGDDGFYVDIDPETQAFTAFEPNLGHGSYLLAKDADGEVFFTRALWSTGSANPELGELTEYPVYLYWNQVPAEPIGEHSYEFLGTPYDKSYDGEPIDFDPAKNIRVDGGKSSWDELEKRGEARLVWRELQGKEFVEIDAFPVEIGTYQLAIQELVGKDWADVLTEYFAITEAEQPHVHDWGEPAWSWAEDYSAATATFTCLVDPSHVVALEATVTSETTDPQIGVEGRTVYTATVIFEEIEFRDQKTVEIPALEGLRAPELTEAFNSATGVRVSWRAVNGAVKYELLRKNLTLNETRWKVVGETAECSLIDKTAKSSNRYTYTVRAIDADGNVSPIDETGRTCTYIAKADITDITVTADGVKLTWSKPAGAKNFRVMRRVDGIAKWTVLDVVLGTEYLDTTAEKGVKYWYTVRGVSMDNTVLINSYNGTGWSMKPLNTPVLTEAFNSATGVRVSWKPNEGAVKYRLLRKNITKNETEWSTIAETTELTFIDTSAASASRYTYTVECVDSNGRICSAQGNPRTCTYIAMAKITSIGSVTNGVKLVWSKPAGAKNFRVFRKTEGGEWTAIKDVQGTGYLDTTAQKGVKYWYTVRAITMDGKMYINSYNSFGWSVTRK
ncbi:MAG: hypothetical protein K6G17_01990 [Oscillospiraceae bacterium]|nr:hypothetical protein [Oscillospiraceae bacterium]